MVGRLQISLYGTRDAAQSWAATYTKFLVKIGFQRGRASNEEQSVRLQHRAQEEEHQYDSARR